MVHSRSLQPCSIVLLLLSASFSHNSLSHPSRLLPAVNSSRFRPGCWLCRWYMSLDLTFSDSPVARQGSQEVRIWRFLLSLEASFCSLAPRSVHAFLCHLQHYREPIVPFLSVTPPLGPLWLDLCCRVGSLCYMVEALLYQMVLRVAVTVVTASAFPALVVASNLCVGGGVGGRRSPHQL